MFPCVSPCRKEPTSALQKAALTEEEELRGRATSSKSSPASIRNSPSLPLPPSARGGVVLRPPYKSTKPTTAFLAFLLGICTT